MAKKLEIIRRGIGVFRHNDSDGIALLNAFIELSANEIIVKSLNSQETLFPGEIYVKDELNDSVSDTFTNVDDLVARLQRLGYVDWNISESNNPNNGLTDNQLRASAIAVETPLPASPIVGQLKIANTGTAIQMPSIALKNGIVIKASSTNAANLFVGPSGVTTIDTGLGNGYKLEPGEAISFSILNTNTLYVNGTAGDIFYYSGN